MMPYYTPIYLYLYSLPAIVATGTINSKSMSLVRVPIRLRCNYDILNPLLHRGSLHVKLSHEGISFVLTPKSKVVGAARRQGRPWSVDVGPRKERRIQLCLHNSGNHNGKLLRGLLVAHPVLFQLCAQHALQVNCSRNNAMLWIMV